MSKEKVKTENETVIPKDEPAIEKNASELEPITVDSGSNVPLADVGSISANLAENQPDVNPHVKPAINSDSGSENNNVQKSGSEKFNVQDIIRKGIDVAGNVFDPEIHATENQEGKIPKVRVNGEFSKKRGSGSPKVKSKIGSTTRQAQNAQAENLLTGESEKAQAVALGNVTANTIINIGLFISDEFQPAIRDGVDEKKALEQCWTDYYIATGKKDLPPWLGLAIGNAAFIMPRLGQPKTRGRLSEFGVNIGAWWKKRKAKKLALKKDQAKKPDQDKKDQDE